MPNSTALEQESRTPTIALLLASAAIAGGYCVLAQLPLWSTGERRLLMANTLVTAALAGAAVLVGHESGHRPTAVGLLIAALIWPLNWVNVWVMGPCPAIAALVGPSASLATAWSLLRYPGGWRRRTGWRVAIALMSVQLVALVPIVTSRPEWQGLPADLPWPALWPDEALYRRSAFGSGLLAALVTAVVAVAILTRWARLRGPDRHTMRPVQAAVVLATLLTMLSSSRVAVAPGSPGARSLYAVQTAALVLIPVAFFVVALQRWLTRAAAPGLLRELAQVPTPGEAQEVLRRALADPTLRLLYVVAGSHVDVGGREATVGPRANCLARVRTRAGEAVLVTENPLLRRYEGLVSAAAVAATLTLDNTILQTTLRSRLYQVESSAAAMTSAVAAERRGVQRTVSAALLAHVLPATVLLREQSRHPHLGAVLAELADGLDHAAHELTVLSRGETPGAVRERGWARAVEDAVRWVTIPVVTCRLTDEPLPPPVETGIYYVVLELVTNVVKHAGAHRLGIGVRTAGDHVHVSVADDGCGGAVAAESSGLDGVFRRVNGLGGAIELVSPPGCGTRVSICFPRSPAATPCRPSPPLMRGNP